MSKPNYFEVGDIIAIKKRLPSNHKDHYKHSIEFDYVMLCNILQFNRYNLVYISGSQVGRNAGDYFENFEIDGMDNCLSYSDILTMLTDSYGDLEDDALSKVDIDLVFESNETIITQHSLKQTTP